MHQTMDLAAGDAGHAPPPPRACLHLDEAFDPWQIQAFRHDLSSHPMLQMGHLAGLCARLEARGSIRTHADKAKPGTPFNSAPEIFPNALSPSETLQRLADAQAWMSLLNIQADPEYRTLVDAVLDSIKPMVDAVDPGMCYRAGWIFVTSPRTVTPFHFDKEHNFLFQINGRKRIYVWDHRDEVVASEQSRDLFHTSHERYLLRWQEAFPERAHVFDLEPGMGAYMPSTSPHMVENGDGPSITVSFTYYTDATRRNAQLHRGHQRLRRMGMQPPAVGQSRGLDALVHGVEGAYAWLRPGANNDGTRYAEAPG